MMSFVLRTTTTTSAPQNSVVVYVSHHHLHRVLVTDADKIVVGVVKLVVVAGNNTQRKQRSPLNRWSFSLLLFYSFRFFFLTLLFFFARVSLLSLLFRVEMRFSCAKNIPFLGGGLCSRNFSAESLPSRFFSSLLFSPLFIFQNREHFLYKSSNGKWCDFLHNHPIAQKKITRTNNNNRKELTPFSSKLYSNT